MGLNTPNGNPTPQLQLNFPQKYSPSRSQSPKQDKNHKHFDQSATKVTSSQKTQFLASTLPLTSCVDLEHSYFHLTSMSLQL